MTIQEEFYKQLEEFQKDSSAEDYRRYSPRNQRVLIKLFKFIPKDSQEKLGTKSILIKSSLDGSWKPSDVAETERIYPIAKVLKVGKAVEDKDIVEGQLYVLPFDDVMGTSWNPDFLHLMNTFGKKGNQASLAHIPDDMPQRISNLEREMKRYKFSMPDRIGNETEDDKLVYLIPSSKLEAIYELD